jgi:hypothetical protein
MDNQQIKNFIEKARGSGATDDEIVSYLQNKGVNLETGKIEQAPEKSSFLDKAKSTVMGFAGGVGGLALGAEDYLARSGLLGEKVQKGMEGKPKLQEQFKQEFSGGNEGAYDIGRFGGEIASLVTPVGAVGKATNVATKTALGSTKLAPKTIEAVGKVAQAGAEGLAFTKGIEIIEGEKQSIGDYALNAGLNMAFPVGGLALKKAGELLPSRIINSLIKPLQKDFAYGKNPGKAVSEMGITANTFEELISKVKEAKQKVGQTIGSLRERSSVPLYIEPQSILSPIDEAIAQASKTPKTNSALIERLNGLRDDISQNLDGGLSPEELKSLVGDLTKWTGNATDDQLVNKALKQTYGAVNSQIDDALKQGLSPEEFSIYKKLNEQYGNLISAENASIYRDKILQRQDLVSFGAKNAGLLTALTTAIATGGAGLGVILAGIGGATIDKAMATPAFKTRLASLLKKLEPKEVKTFFDKIPTAKELFSEQQIKSYIENPKMGLSIEDVSKKGKGTIPENSLIKEAKKYKSAEDFVKAQGTPIYRGEGGSNVAQGKALLAEGKHFASDSKYPQGFGKVSENIIKKSAKVLDLGDSTFAEISQKLGIPERRYISPKELSIIAKEKGYDVLKYNGEYKSTGKQFTHFVDLTGSSTITKSQLEEIWNKANKK